MNREKTILDHIIDKKKIEIAAAKSKISIAQLMDFPLFNRTCFVLRDFVLQADKSGIIAEFKRASPSKGIINDHSTVKDVVRDYAAAGVSAISVLTDQDFFKGDLTDLQKARETVNIPLLRKDFIIDAYQIVEAKAYGADIILLIAAVLSADEIKHLATYAKQLGLNVLLEIHNEEELQKSLIDEIDAIGVNNRNLKDFKVSIQHSLDLVDKIPDHYIKVSESGISDPKIIKELKAAGFDAFLIGENFMKTASPGIAIQQFSAQIKSTF